MKIAVLGTNTEVGKTFVSALIAMLLKELGENALILKPVETGEPDTSYLQKLGIEARSIYRFKTPATPLLSAQIEGREINIRYLLQECRRILERENVILEGVGGVASPIWYGFDSAELVARLKLKVLLIARNELGAITSTVTAAKYLEMKGVEIAAVVLNLSSDDVVQRKNGEVISGILHKEVFILKKESFESAREKLRVLLEFLSSCTTP